MDNSKDLIVMNEHRLGLQALYCFLSQSTVNSSAFNVHILLRNPYNSIGKTALLLSKIAKYGVRIWSYDQNDCERYDFIYYPQFIERIEGLKDINTQYDFSFVGRDKGRYGLLGRLESQLDELGYVTYFDIRGSNSKNSWQSESLTYIEYLERYLKATCMIEILQEGQYGITLRPLEAMVYGRKLLTNNQNIIKEEFYHPNNIFLLESDVLDFNKLEEFMLKPLVNIKKSVIDFHTATGVLNMLYETK